jgi:hypothetical protein
MAIKYFNRPGVDIPNIDTLTLIGSDNGSPTWNGTSWLTKLEVVVIMLILHQL